MSDAALELAAREISRLGEQDRIDATRSLAQRNRDGQYATPPVLAADIVRAALGRSEGTGRSVRFGEPSIGTGSFFSALLRLLPPDDIEHAMSFEIDPAFAGVARDLWRPHGLSVIEGDFTDTANWPPATARPNLVIANPPYVRHHHLDRSRKEMLRAAALRAAGVPVSGLAGLYVYFMLIAHDWLEDGGLASWLVPAEFMSVNYGSALRRYLTEQVTLLSIHRFDPSDVQFADALVSSAVVTFRKQAPPPGHAAEFSFGGSVSAPLRTQLVPINTLSGTPKWTGFPSQAGGRVVVPEADGALRVGDLFDIRRGIATGANGVFIMERSRAAERGIPDRFLLPMLPSPRYLRQEVIEPDADGYPDISPQLALLDCDLPEEQLARECPALWYYLQEAERAGVRNGYLVSSRTPWYRQERRAAPPFLCTYMGRSENGAAPVRFILNRSRAVATNVYLMLYPKARLATLLDQRPEEMDEVFDLLRSITAARLIDGGRAYGGGLHKMEPGELANLSAQAFSERYPALTEPQAPQLALALA